MEIQDEVFLIPDLSNRWQLEETKEVKQQIASVLLIQMLLIYQKEFISACSINVTWLNTN